MPRASTGPGLIVVYTGNGKGKTTAALGLAFRAVGRGKRVFMVQFIKGSQSSGEYETVKHLGPDLEIVPKGIGFVPTPAAKRHPKHIAAVQQAWELGIQKATSGDFDVVIFDEINNALSYGMLDPTPVLEFLRQKPEQLDIVLTGRDALPEIIEVADLVTEMREIKHPYQKGLAAREGIDF
ncbi:MAG: cob(I)yrinic acid a,c-diamide adenosyltransferase [Chloroflexota bacterium]|nr:MAG: cob(I)yrinic acid a,c-diamide adenosyltransferase [Chloroflexota bacterium]